MSRLALLILIGGCLLGSRSVISPGWAADPGNAAQLFGVSSGDTPEPEPIILSLWVGRDCLTDSLDALVAFPLDPTVEPITLLPVKATCEALGYGVSVDATAGTITARGGGSAVLFTLHPAGHRVTRAGETTALDPAALISDGDDPLVEVSQLATWLGCTLTAQTGTLSVHAKAPRPFPVQLRKERERRAGLLHRGQAEQSDGGPHVDSHYQNFTAPLVDQTVTLQAGGGRSGLGYFAQMSGDIAHMGYNVSLSRQPDGGTDGQVKLSRFDPDGQMLGPLHARSVLLGEFTSTELPLTAGSHQVRGVTVSSYPLTNASLFDQRTLTGYAPPGWDAELFRGDTLLDYQIIGDSGRYEFRDIPLLYGQNDIRVVLHGPHSEIKEVREEAFVGAAMLTPGKAYYRLSAGRALDGGTLASAEAEWGMRRDLSVAAVAATVETDSGRRQIISTGLRGYGKRGYAAADLTAAADGGIGGQLRATALLGKVTAVAGYLQARGLTGEIKAAAESTNTAFLRLDNLRLGQRLPLALAWNWRRGARGMSESVSARMSGESHGFYHSTLLDWRRESAVGASFSQFTGTTLVSRYRHGGSMDLQLDYLLAPSPRLEALSASWRRDLHGNRSLNLGLQHYFGGGSHTLNASLAQQRGGHGRSLNATWSEDRGLTVGLGFSSSFGYLPGKGWKRSSQPLTSEPTVLAHVFLDKNANGRRDRDEPALRDVGFFINNTSSTASTDSDGIALVGRLPAFEYASLRVSRSTLDDGRFVPSPESLAVRARPGKPLTALLPVVPTGEITGTVYVESQGQRREAGGVTVEVVNAEGKVVKSARSAFDGMYDLCDVPVGKYLLRARVPEQATASFGECAREIVLLGEEALIENADLLLTRLPATGAAAQ